MVECRSCDVTDMGLKSQGGVKDDTQVADYGGWSDGAAIHFQKKIPNHPEQWLGGHDHELSFIAVQFE